MLLKKYFSETDFEPFFQLNRLIMKYILFLAGTRLNIMPALDINLVQQLGRDLHSVSPGYMGEDEVCPWTLFLTMALTLLKGE